MKAVLDFFYIAAILFSAVMAFFSQKHLRSRHLYILVPYLFLVFIQETILTLGNQFNFFTVNAIVYNIYRAVTVITFAFIYYKIPFMGPFRKWIAWLTVLYLTISLVNYCFIESISTASSYLILARGFVMTFYGILFLFRYFNLDNLAEEKFWHPLIWITIGVVTFYPVVTISLHFQKHLSEYSATLYGFKLYHMIPKVMSIFMYSCFGYAFYLCKKKN